MLRISSSRLFRLAGGFALSSGAAGISYCSPTAPIRCNDGTTVIPWSAPTRESQIDRLKGEIFDVVVIGGGCVGAGCAWEAATRGLKVALIERDDFAAGTSGYVETKIMIILIEIEKSRLILSHYTNNNSSYLSYSFPLY